MCDLSESHERLREASALAIAARAEALGTVPGSAVEEAC